MSQSHASPFVTFQEDSVRGSEDEFLRENPQRSKTNWRYHPYLGWFNLIQSDSITAKTIKNINHLSKHLLEGMENINNVTPLRRYPKFKSEEFRDLAIKIHSFKSFPCHQNILLPHLVGSLEHVSIFLQKIGNVIIPIDFHSYIFQRGWFNHQKIIIA